jgi:hypothetical protein
MVNNKINKKKSNKKVQFSPIMDDLHTRIQRTLTPYYRPSSKSKNKTHKNNKDVSNKTLKQRI